MPFPDSAERRFHSEEAMDVKNAARKYDRYGRTGFSAIFASVKRIFAIPLRYLLDSIKNTRPFSPALILQEEQKNTPRSHRLNSIRYSVVPASSCFVPCPLKSVAVVKRNDTLVFSNAHRWSASNFSIAKVISAWPTPLFCRHGSTYSLQISVPLISCQNLL